MFNVNQNTLCTYLILFQEYSSTDKQVAPVTSRNLVGVQRAEIKDGVRMVVLCKDANGKMGLRVRHVSKVLLFYFILSPIILPITRPKNKVHLFDYNSASALIYPHPNTFPKSFSIS